MTVTVLVRTVVVGASSYIDKADLIAYLRAEIANHEKNELLEKADVLSHVLGVVEGLK